MNRRTVVTGLALVLLPACGGRQLIAPEDLPDDLQVPPLSVGAWEQVQRDGFSFALPPGFQKESGIPIDSDAATYVRGDDALHYDFGVYTGPWWAQPHIPATDVKQAWVKLAGREAQLVSYRLDGRYVVRAWWEEVGRSAVGDVHLLVRGESATAAGREELLAVLHSVRFD